jgi:hypothetical protein
MRALSRSDGVSAASLLAAWNRSVADAPVAAAVAFSDMTVFSFGSLDCFIAQA